METNLFCLPRHAQHPERYVCDLPGDKHCSFTLILTRYNNPYGDNRLQGGDFSDDYDDEDDGYDEDYSGIQPTSGTEYSTERTTSTSAYGGSSESFTKPKDVPKLMLQGEERD